MNIDWSALGVVSVASFGAAVGAVVLVALALVGLSARANPSTRADTSLSPAAGTAVAAVCLLATVLIVLYGLWIIVS